MNQNISIIGAGTMGSGIAQKYAAHGFNVLVIDQLEASLLRAQTALQENLSQALKRGLIDEAAAHDTASRMSFSTKLSDASNSALCIEAIFEDLEQKTALFQKLENIVDKQTIMATNTSSFLVADMQRGLQYPERFLGLHYFYPPLKNRLVEVIAADLTSACTLEKARAWQNDIQKTLINAKDSPGFVVNRFFVPWLNEAARMLDEKVANVATIEKAAQQYFEINLGPFKLMNLTGPAITLHASRSLAKSLGEFYAPSPVIQKLHEENRLFDLEGQVDEKLLPEIGMRLLNVVSKIVRTLVFEEKVASIEDVDLGACVGLAWKRGPFAMMKAYKLIS